VIINVPYGVPENEPAQKKAMDAGIIVMGHEAEPPKKAPSTMTWKPLTTARTAKK
jgi:ABC-type sugar transport system substrate-binding protein